VILLGWDFEDFYISKSYVVADIDQFISAVMGWGGDINSEAMGQITPNLHHSLEDMEEKLLNPYEADAMEISIRTGQLLDHYAKAYHAGPTDPNFQLAMEEGLRIGKPMINEAATRQNALNAERGIGAVPLPFDKNGSDPAKWPVNSYHRQENSALVQAQKMKDGSYNPWHTQNGKLVTHITSGHNGQNEGYARWYEEAAKDMGLIGVKYNRSGRKDDRNRYTIPAEYVHRNVITINDRHMRDRLGRLVRDLQGQAEAQGLDPESSYNFVREGFMNDNLVYHGTHHGHHNFDSTYDRNQRKTQQAAEIRSGDLMTPEEEEDFTQVRPRGEGQVSDEIIHPELKDSKWFQHLGKGAYRGNKKMVREIARHHELDEEDVSRIMNDAYENKIRGRSARDRILNGLYDTHMRSSGGRSPIWYNGPEVPVPDVQPQPEETQPMPTQAQPTLPAEQPPAHIPRIPLPAAPLSSATVNAPIPTGPSYVPPLTRITQGNSDIQGFQSPSVSGQGRGLLSRLAGLLGKMSVDDILLRSDDFRHDFEEYIEEVQLELAKSVIEDLTPLGQLSVDSPMDVALLSSKVQMGTTDVVSIFHTRGDWRQIAKAFNIPHESVQMVKVALYA